MEREVMQEVMGGDNQVRSPQVIFDRSDQLPVEFVQVRVGRFQ